VGVHIDTLLCVLLLWRLLALCCFVLFCLFRLWSDAVMIFTWGVDGPAITSRLYERCQDMLNDDVACETR
jgi:hypothetical protein